MEQKEIRYESYYKNKLTLMYPGEIIRFEVPMLTTHVRADAVLLGDPVTAFEIKTEKDTLDRLENQVKNYLKVFPKVCVMAHSSKAEKAAGIVRGTPAEVWSVDDDGVVETIAKGSVDYSGIDSDAVFAFFRKDEREYVLQKYFHLLPSCTDFDRYRNRQEMFRSLPTDTIVKEMRNICYLRWRGSKMNKDFWGLE